MKSYANLSDCGGQSPAAKRPAPAITIDKFYLNHNNFRRINEKQSRKAVHYFLAIHISINWN
jgi:hypothetical protein